MLTLIKIWVYQDWISGWTR